MDPNEINTDEIRVYLIKDTEQAIYASHNGDGPSIICDFNGKTYEPDLIIVGRKNYIESSQGRDAGEFSLLAEFPDEFSFVRFGERLYEGTTRMSLVDIVRQISDKGIRDHATIGAIIGKYEEFLCSF